jgi:hypothetical protein
VTSGLPLGSQPYKPLCLSHKPKAKVATIKAVTLSINPTKAKNFPKKNTRDVLVVLVYMCNSKLNIRQVERLDINRTQGFTIQPC